MSQALSFRGKIMSDLDIVSNYRKGKLPITKKLSQIIDLRDHGGNE